MASLTRRVIASLAINKHSAWWWVIWWWRRSWGAWGAWGAWGGLGRHGAWATAWVMGAAWGVGDGRGHGGGMGRMGDGLGHGGAAWGAWATDTPGRRRRYMIKKYHVTRPKKAQKKGASGIHQNAPMGGGLR